jgi:hypothetical protein
MVIASIVGVWLFSVQHLFERAQWMPDGSWSFAAASLTDGLGHRAMLVEAQLTLRLGALPDPDSSARKCCTTAMTPQSRLSCSQRE